MREARPLVAPRLSDSRHGHAMRKTRRLRHAVSGAGPDILPRTGIQANYTPGHAAPQVYVPPANDEPAAVLLGWPEEEVAEWHEKAGFSSETPERLKNYGFVKYYQKLEHHQWNPPMSRQIGRAHV